MKKTRRNPVNALGLPLKLVFNGPLPYSPTRDVVTGSGTLQQIEVGIISEPDGGIHGSFTFRAESVPMIAMQVRAVLGEAVTHEWLRGLDIGKAHKSSAVKIVIHGNALSAVISMGPAEYLPLTARVTRRGRKVGRNT